MVDFQSVDTGDVLANRYELREVIGTGGFAQVWTARDRDSGREVAVKVGTDRRHDADTVQTQFEQAIQVHRRIQNARGHENIVRFIDGHVSSTQAYVVTELLEGGALSDSIGSTRQPGPDAVFEIGRQLIDALCFLHEQRVLHLDIKPANVLFRDESTPVVIDFNTAVRSRTHDETLFYHDAYKPPEQLPGEGSDINADKRSDIYALGLVLAYLLTGREFDDRELTDSGVDPSTVGASCSDALAGTLKRATEGHPNDRYPDACAIQRAVDGCEPSAATATLLATDTDEAFDIAHGDAFGRNTTGEQTPALVIQDDEQYLSPIHAVFERHGNGWQLRDTSLNGTAVKTDTGWLHLLGPDGVARRKQANEPLPQNERRQVCSLSDGDLIAPVDPNYGIRFRFRTGL